MNHGWIKLFRKFQNWEWYTHANVKIAFLHCLLKANHKDKMWREINIKRGQFVTSQFNFGTECGLSRHKVRSAWDKLVATSEITIESTSENSIVTVCNYEDYQGEPSEGSTSEITNQSTNQPNQSTSEPANEPANESTSEPTSEPTSETPIVTVNNYKDYQREPSEGSTSESTSESTNQSTSESTSESATTREEKKKRSNTCSKELATTSKEYVEINELGELLYHGGSFEQWFNAFWDVYPDRGPARNPKKKSKEYMQKKVKKEGHDPKIIYMGAKVFKKTVEHLEGEERRSIPMSSTWIKGEEYNDFYERFKKSSTPATLQQYQKNGWIDEVTAQKYAESHYRESLSESINQFKTVTVENEKLYKPLEA